jgi:superfamily II DNA or RNA helicase
MTEQQSDWLKSLPEEEARMMRLAIAYTRFNLIPDILSAMNMRRNFTEKKMKEFFEEARKVGVVESGNLNYGYNPSYNRIVTRLLPELIAWAGVEAVPVWKKLIRFYYGSNGADLALRDLLFGMISNDPELERYENNVFRLSESPPLSLVSLVFSIDVYHDGLKKLKTDNIRKLYQFRILVLLDFLVDLDAVEEHCNVLRKLVAYDISNDPYKQRFLLHRGKLDLREGNEEPDVDFYCEAMVQQLKYNPSEALKLYEECIEFDRDFYRNLQLPPDTFYSIFYQALLLSLSPAERTKRYKKIDRYLKQNEVSILPLHQMIADFVMNSTASLKENQRVISGLIRQYDFGAIIVYNFMGLYMTDYQPDEELRKKALQLTGYLIERKYYLLANEMLFIAGNWCPGKDADDFRAELSNKVSFQPVLSYLAKEEAWERPLNLLLSLGGKGIRNASAAKAREDKTRVGYFFDSEQGVVTPFVQTRSAKGVWSQCREITLRSFFSCKTPGLTEQDIRIAKTLKQIKSYGSTYYNFQPQVFFELVGHPYIFLRDSLEVPVDFVLSQPVVRVTKTGDGYTLTCDTSDSENALQLVKETNTRFKVYKLTPSQLSMIRILSDHKLRVPEKGKQKLTQLLGEMSKNLTVHSDLIDSDLENLTVVQVEPDSRTRIQLLPFLDGLKVELYSKPFGDRAPYCKPGVGGKVLVANVKQQQLQVQRHLQEEKSNADFLLEKIQQIETMENSAGLFSFGNPLDALEVLELAAAHPEKCVLEWPEGARFSLRSRIDFSQLQLRTKSKNNWFELEGELKVDEKLVLTLQQLLALGAKAEQKFVEIKPGEFLSLSDELRKKLSELSGFVTRGKESLQLNKFAAAAMGDFFTGAASFKSDKGWTDLKSRVEQASFTEVVVPAALQAELRPYQEEGFRWMMRLAQWEAGACLADDMGLGKTIQTLAVLLERKSLGPQLVVCPVSVLNNWRSEIRRFAPVLQIKVLGMSGREDLMKDLSAGEVLLTTYGLLQSESELLSSVTFATAVLDEAHIIKNMATKTSKASMQLNAQFRVALTGTPVQNHPGEIWNLFQFLNPGLLGTIQQFTSTFIKNDADASRPQLRKLISPFILRRTKSRVLDELPPKTEVIRYVQLSDEETAFYETLRRNALAAIEADDSNAGTRQLKVLAEITRLRQACCNVKLVNPELKLPSSKLNSFLEVVDELRENSHRALVFSQFVAHLTLVRQALDHLKINYLYLDGSTPAARREELVNAFQRGDGELFLISLKAGGLGLNLTAADYVIHLDPWWNPAIEDQASDRAHRIGQTRPVTVYRLVAAATIEEKIIQLHQTKKDLADSLLEGSDLSARLAYHEMVELLKETV